ncbi:MAG: glucose-1-phosphate adenylyltransferase [Bacilli bacterium]|jgi:glucose-1-phosphate adenylyltransferase|nr:glucose-1-phosphate adenylyltransferase [Bacilli bacterium]
MLNKKECVAMLLAGGQGSRLYALTNKIAKPAVSYGAKYRIIDFPLSNCINSNIDTVGVLTQYQPLLLNDYIGNGQPWDLDRTFGGVHILPPYQGKNKTDWYKGTANAIYQNIVFMKRYNPEYIIILSGDHIYKMDYSKMLNFHKEKNAEATIAVIDVSLQEASRFGIMNTDSSMRIQEFEEKPVKPKSTKASMGIYIFNAELLYQYLEADAEDSHSQNDFGKNIIPNMLNDGKLMYAYPFSGYWKDVGTIDSLWEANMDLLGEEPQFNIFDKSWKIYSRNEAYPPQFICEGSKIENSLLTVGCYIEGHVKNSLLSENVRIGKNAKVIDSILFDNVVVEDGAVVEYSIIAENVVIKKQAKIGADRQQINKITVLGSEVTIDEHCQVIAGQMIEKDVRK